MTVIWLLWLPVTLAAPKIFPLVDPGLFVISGVKTCGEGGGYCLLGLDCTLDEDFLPDNGAGQHCDGLKSAFTPSAHFVCCKATNKTAYKPPIAHPPILSTTLTEPMTARTTTLNILENEIDQVLQKVAQSVNSVKKTPVTETALPVYDDSDQTSVKYELEEADEEEEESELMVEDEEEEEMVADSPIEQLWQNASEDDDMDDESSVVLEENNETKVLVQSNIPPNSNPTVTDSFDQTPKIEEYEIEKNSEENTVIPSGKLEDSEAEESNKNKSTDDSKENKNNKENIPPESNTNKDYILQENSSKHTEEDYSQLHIIDANNSINLESHTPSQETKENTHTESNVKEETLTDVDSFSKSPTLEVTPSLVEDTSITHKNTVKKQEDSIFSNKENVEDNLSFQLTPMPDTQKIVMKDNKPTSNNTSDSKLTNLQTIENSLNKENTVQKSENENLVSSVMDDEKTFEPVIVKESDSQIPNVQNVNETKQVSQITPEPDENKFATATTMTPDTHLSNDIRPSVTQARPGSDDPCAKVTNGKCTQEVKFVFNDQTLCFGSVYALDWVVTSASCALRIFRAGMLNVTISPLTEMSKGHVKTIVVHESYAENSGASGQGMEANNIGLVQLQTPMVEWSRCVPCLPEIGKEFTGINCSAVTSQPLATSLPQLCARAGDCETARSENTVNTCEGPSRMMADDIGFSYITLNCDILWEPRFFDPTSRGSGAPLFCEGGVLAGVETGAGVGLMVYTPLTPYIPWLLKNTRPGSDTPEQTFNVG